MKCRVSSVECRDADVGEASARFAFSASPVNASTRQHSRAFTLIELLVVISILGIMAALTVPVLKNFAKSDATLSASRQLLDGVARARQLAISQRTTVYMVFVPTNFWNDSSGTWPIRLVEQPDPGATNRRHQSVRQAIDRLTPLSPAAAMGDQPGNTPGIILSRGRRCRTARSLRFRNSRHRQIIITPLPIRLITAKPITSTVLPPTPFPFPRPPTCR